MRKEVIEVKRLGRGLILAVLIGVLLFSLAGCGDGGGSTADSGTIQGSGS